MRLGGDEGVDAESAGECDCSERGPSDTRRPRWLSSRPWLHVRRDMSADHEQQRDTAGEGDGAVL